ncbi:DNA-directed DNA polymerase alpha catalytic subunit pol1 [Batrachochytrium dendrobatidis]
MSSRRSADAYSKRQTLQRLKELRESGNTSLRDYEVAGTADIFDVVTEEEYNTLSKRTRLEDDFVVDDNGEGYANGGLEDWDNPQSGQSSTDEDGDAINTKFNKTKSTGKGGNSEKRKRDKKSLVNPATGSASIVSMLSKQSKASEKSVQKTGDQTLEESTQLLDSILESLDDVVSTQEEKRRRVHSTTNEFSANTSIDNFSGSLFSKFQLKESLLTKASTVASKSFDSAIVGDREYAQDGLDIMNNDESSANNSPSNRVGVYTNNQSMDTLDLDSAMEVSTQAPLATKPVSVTDAETVQKSSQVKIRKLQKSSANSKSAKSAAHFLPKFEQVAVATAASQPSVISSTEMAGCVNWKNVKDTVAITNVSSNEESSFIKSNIGQNDILEPDGSLKMYWFDSYEKHGIVYLFGKVYQPLTQRHVSCCLVVKNIQRNLFVLPRPIKLDDLGIPTDTAVTMADVYQEFDTIRQKHQISEFSSRSVSRKYAFELPNIPSESDYLKVLYPFSEPELPSDISGKTFSRVFGTRTRAMELLILKRKLMGPCWISIKNVKVSTPMVSWCKLEFIADDPKSIRVFSDSDPDAPKQAPPFVVMSLSLRTYMNHQKKVNEIVSASALVYNHVNIEGDTTDDNAVRLTVVRQLNQIPIPVEFMEMANRQRTKLVVLPNEMSLLNYLLANIYQLDPDVLVGHNIVDFDLDVLLHRMKIHKTQNWSRIGRLRRTVWPVMQTGAGGTGDSSFSEREIASGRLMCDTYRTAKDLIQSKSYSLTSLAASQLKIERPNIDFDKIPSYFWNSEKLMEMVQHCEFDTFLTCQLMFKLQVLPLTKQLTNLAGNIWSRSLTGARAERNEYLLLHEFHDRKYITPDKVYSNRVVSNQLDENDAEGTGAVTKKGGRRKAAYAGGLVLEPKKGFYDKYVLMLDFNSLYPSIIQEYNICFTTIARSYDNNGDHMPTPPNSSVDRGILPKLLGTLVNRRQLVKGLMKDPKNTPAELAQYDIRQKALKLTANSMYGCLGFVNFRFYAEPLAMLITSKGREILQNTVDLAEKSNLDVIYGDTDSIMIYTNSTDLAEVKRIGQELKRAVNKRYNLLEIELDGFFERMLLLKKKKYAAILVEEKDGQLKRTIETKGLDLVRRDWCGISFDASNYVLQQIFSGETREEAVEQIHQYLNKLGVEVRSGTVPLEKFIINKGLTKNPEEYSDKNSLPHVQVALALKARGGMVRAGDTIPYVICQGESTHVAQRARHPDDITKQGSTEKIDFNWYLSNQVHPPITRLCQHIEGTDTARLADSLGLDMTKFSSTAQSRSFDDTSAADIYTFESQISDEEKFKDIKRWSPRCIHCGESSEFKGAVYFKDGTAMSGLTCANPMCGQTMPIPSLAVQLRVAICAQMRVYLDQSVVCDDPSCLNITKATSVFGRRCLVPGCKGTVFFQLSDRTLYLQMQYFESLFDIPHVTKTLEKSAENDEIANFARSILTRTISDIKYLGQLVEQYLSTNARRWVDLGKLFSFHQAM